MTDTTDAEYAEFGRSKDAFLRVLGTPPVLGPQTKEQSEWSAALPALIKNLLMEQSERNRYARLWHEVATDDDIRIDIRGASISPWYAPGHQRTVAAIVARVVAPVQLDLLAPLVEHLTADGHLTAEGKAEVDRLATELREALCLASRPHIPSLRQLPEGRKVEALRAAGYCCAWCGKSPPEVVLEVDHIIPFSRGGSDALDNLQVLCRGCNRGKGARMEHEL